METYIQVAGQGDLIETVVEQRATLTITVKASKTEVALAEATSLRNDAIRTLRESGLTHDEISEGGRDAWQPWYMKRSVGQEVAHRVLIACRDVRRLYRALDALEPLFTNARYTMSVEMQPPRACRMAAVRASASAPSGASKRGGCISTLIV